MYIASRYQVLVSRNLIEEKSTYFTMYMESKFSEQLLLFNETVQAQLFGGAYQATQKYAMSMQNSPHNSLVNLMIS